MFDMPLTVEQVRAEKARRNKEAAFNKELLK